MLLPSSSPHPRLARVLCAESVLILRNKAEPKEIERRKIAWADPAAFAGCGPEPNAGSESNSRGPPCGGHGRGIEVVGEPMWHVALAQVNQTETITGSLTSYTVHSTSRKLPLLALAVFL